MSSCDNESLLDALENGREIYAKSVSPDNLMCHTDRSFWSHQKKEKLRGNLKIYNNESRGKKTPIVFFFFFSLLMEIEPGVTAAD